MLLKKNIYPPGGAGGGIDLDFHCEGQIRTMDSSNILQLGTLVVCMYIWRFCQSRFLIKQIY